MHTHARIPALAQRQAGASVHARGRHACLCIACMHACTCISLSSCIARSLARSIVRPGWLDGKQSTGWNIQYIAMHILPTHPHVCCLVGGISKADKHVLKMCGQARAIRPRTAATVCRSCAAAHAAATERCAHTLLMSRTRSFSVAFFTKALILFSD